MKKIEAAMNDDTSSLMSDSILSFLNGNASLYDDTQASMPDSLLASLYGDISPDMKEYKLST